MTDSPAPSAPSTAHDGSSACFDEFPEPYDRFTDIWDGISTDFDDWVRDSLPAAARSGLDLGCGAGRQSVLLADRAEQVLAVDISQRMLEIARAKRPRPNIHYLRRGVLDVSPENGPFDVVVSAHTLHHAGDPAVVLPHVRSLVAPGGTLIVADIIDPGDWTTVDFHVNRAFNDAALVYELGSDGAAAADVLRLLLHPRWLQLTQTDIPLSRQEFHRVYRQTFSGIHFVDDLNPIMCGAVWHAPA